MRSLLFVPADSPRKLDKALASPADALIIDLEDSVAPAGKTDARAAAAAFIAANRARKPLFARINGLATGLADADLAAVVAARPAGIMLPKAAGPADVVDLAARLRVHEAEAGLPDGAMAILPIITETARATLFATEWRAPLPRLAGLTWGAEDLSADLGAMATRDEAGGLTPPFEHARTVTLLAAAACETAAIDTVFVDFADGAGLSAECRAAARDGFVGKMAIHPGQIETINAAFTPTPAALDAARAVVAAFAAAPGAGVVAIAGVMVDLPHLRRAERLLARAAKLAG